MGGQDPPLRYSCQKATRDPGLRHPHTLLSLSLALSASLTHTLKIFLIVSDRVWTLLQRTLPPFPSLTLFQAHALVLGRSHTHTRSSLLHLNVSKQTGRVWEREREREKWARERERGGQRGQPPGVTSLPLFFTRVHLSTPLTERFPTGRCGAIRRCRRTRPRTHKQRERGPEFKSKDERVQSKKNSKNLNRAAPIFFSSSKFRFHFFSLPTMFANKWHSDRNRGFATNFFRFFSVVLWNRSRLRRCRFRETVIQRTATIRPRPGSEPGFAKKMS